MGDNRIIEQQRSDKNYRTTKKVRSKFRYVFFTPSEENRIIEQQGTVNNRTFVLLNFRSIIPALTIRIKNMYFFQSLISRFPAAVFHHLGVKALRDLGRQPETSSPGHVSLHYSGDFLTLAQTAQTQMSSR